MLIHLALLLALQLPWEGPTYTPCTPQRAEWAAEHWARAEAHCIFGERGRIRYKVVQETDFELTASPEPLLDNPNQRRTAKPLYIRYQVGFQSPFGFVVSGKSTVGWENAFQRIKQAAWPPLGR